MTTKYETCPHGGGTYTTRAWNIGDIPVTYRVPLCKACRAKTAAGIDIWAVPKP